MEYRRNWGTCDFKMTEILQNHHDTAYFVVLTALALPLIISWFIIVVGNVFVAARLFRSPLKRARNQELSSANHTKARVVAAAHDVRSSSIVSDQIIVPMTLPARSAIRASLTGLTKLESSVIKCTLSLSCNYMFLQLIFILQILVYVAKPDLSVFQLLSISEEGKTYATLWYYMALPITGFVNTLMLIRHNKNLRGSLRKMVVRRCYSCLVVLARCWKGCQGCQGCRGPEEPHKEHT